jgi:hypothetical protein
MTAPALTETQGAEAAELYAAGQTTRQIGAHFGVGHVVVWRTLRRRGVVLRVGKLTEAQRTEAVELYAVGRSSLQIGAQFGVSHTTILDLLHGRAVAMRSISEAQTVHTLRHDAFDVLTPDAAYWCGFLFADGSAYPSLRGADVVSSGLTASDRGHLEKFRAFLGSTHTIIDVPAKTCFGRYTRRPKAQFQATSGPLAARLRALGRYEGTIAEGLVTSCHFWRGVVDGDGSLGLYRDPRPPHLVDYAHFQLDGSLRLLGAFLTFLGGQGLAGRMKVRPHKSIYRVGTTRGAATRIVNLLYHDAPTALDRKAARASEILKALREAA